MEKKWEIDYCIRSSPEKNILFRSSFFGAYSASCNGSAILISSLVCKWTDSSL